MSICEDWRRWNSELRKEQNAKRKKVITPEEMPWENSPQVLIIKLHGLRLSD
jgi:hypothetical protein